MSDKPLRYHVEVKGKLRWHYRIVSFNGQVISTSQVYFSKGNAVRAAKVVAEEFHFGLVVR